MTIAFPPSPTVGQTYTYMTQEWVWNGKGWAQVVQPSGSGFAVTFISMMEIIRTPIVVPETIVTFIKV